jgi:putative FmdB family regulatory protein
MPIYEYLCAACGHQEDHLQKISEPALTKCPACGKKKYAKQLTAAGFQLKGSGWYATDFKGGGKKADESKPEAKAEGKKEEAKTEAKAETKTETKAETKKTPASTTN